jgi:hypothetical protein
VIEETVALALLSLSYLVDDRLISVLHLVDEERQIRCTYIQDARIIWELTINIPHQFMGAMASPVEYGCFVDDRNPLELIIGDKRPFGKMFPELLRHVLVAA